MRNEPKLPAGSGQDRLVLCNPPLPLCCRTAGTSVESRSSSIVAFFNLDKTVISRSISLAFGPPLYQRGVIRAGGSIEITN
jgi:hypothetical protein